MGKTGNRKERARRHEVRKIRNRAERQLFWNSDDSFSFYLLWAEHALQIEGPTTAKRNAEYKKKRENR